MRSKASVVARARPSVAVAGGLHRVALGDEAIAQRELQAGLVFDEQQASVGHQRLTQLRRRPRPSAGASSERRAARESAASSAGRQMVKVLPRPGSLCQLDPAAVGVDDPPHQAQARARCPGSGWPRRRGRGRTARTPAAARRRRGRDRGRPRRCALRAATACRPATRAPAPSGRRRAYFTALPTRFCTADCSDGPSPTSDGSSLAISSSTVDAGPFGVERGVLHGVVDHVGRRERRHRQRPPRAEAGQLQHPLHRLAQPPRFGLDGGAVALDPRRIADHAVGEVAGGRVDHGHRRAQLVRHRGHELHLLPGERLRRGAPTPR